MNHLITLIVTILSMKFQISPGRVVSGFILYRVGSGRVSDYLVLDHFEFCVVLGWVMGHLVSDHFGFQV
jgi:hypothetical protein